MGLQKNVKKSFDRPVCWWVLSPTYTTDYSWYEPPEYERDVLMVYAKDAHRAKVLAIRAWRRNWYKGCHKGRTITKRKPYIVLYDDENPMAVLKVTRSNLNGIDLTNAF